MITPHQIKKAIHFNLSLILSLEDMVQTDARKAQIKRKEEEIKRLEALLKATENEDERARISS